MMKATLANKAGIWYHFIKANIVFIIKYSFVGYNCLYQFMKHNNMSSLKKIVYCEKGRFCCKGKILAFFEILSC